MSGGRKRSATSDQEAGPPAKKRGIHIKTAERWVSDNDKALNTSLWLRFEMAGLLKCAICSEFEDKLTSMRNFQPSFIQGSSNVRTSTFKEHAATEMHARAMALFKKRQGGDIREYVPIVKALCQPTMDAVTMERKKRKFDVAYTIAKEKLAFTKMKPICELKERHGVDLGPRYRNDQVCATFLEFIAREQIDLSLAALSRSKFYSLQSDASTDAGNTEVGLFLALHFDPFATDGKVHVRDRFFAVRHLSRARGEGLFETFKRAVECVGTTDWMTKMIGFGCDGTNANIADGGLKGHLVEAMPWVVVFWCLSHRLELALKDALKTTFFATIDDLLMCIYYIYEKSPKKCRELKEVVLELKACLEFTEMPCKGGSRPLRACGTRFVAHKVAALGRLIDRFGAYLSHLTTLTEDASVKSTDRQKLKGYILKWQDAKVLLGCAYFHDLLKPSSILCKVLQENELCVVRAIESVTKTGKSLDKLKSVVFEELPTVKKVLERVKSDESGRVSYQGSDLKAYDEGLTYLKSHYVEWTTAVETCLRNCIKFQDTDLLTHAVTLLATNGWERRDTPSFGYPALDAICDRFRVPLESASVDCSLVQDEWDDVVEYGKPP